MVTSVLVVTQAPDFGELIQIALENESRYDVVWVDGGNRALEQARRIPFEVAILDAEGLELPLLQLVEGLRKSLPAVSIIVVPPNNDPSHPSLVGADVQGFLTKPFYVPDLVRMVGRIASDAKPPQRESPPQEIAASVVPSTTAGHAALRWLEDVNRAAQHLTRLSLESSAQAALLLRADQLWAYAGHLSQSAMQELVEYLVNHRGGKDLAKFVHLKATGADYMLYATGLGGELALALVFDANTPFSKMRAQAASLAKALASPPVEAVRREELPPPPVTQETEEDIPVLDLGDVPPPLPRHGKRPKKRPLALPEVEEEEPPKVAAPPLGLPPAFEREALPRALSPDVALPSPAEVTPTAPQEWIPASEAETHPVTLVTPRQNETISLPPPPAPEEAVPQLTPPSPTVVSLKFACVLVPRMPQHHLIGELAEHLPEMMSQICLAFGWRLEHISIRPDYLQWILSAPPATSPSYLMRILRQQTSQRLFAAFPALVQENPSGDFWAPGYLIMSSHQPPPPQVVKDFVQNTRKHQGL